MSIISSPTIVGSGGGSQLNIAYGQTAPTDTSKIWIKANEPEEMTVGLSNGSVTYPQIINSGSTGDTLYGPTIATDGTDIYLMSPFPTTSYSHNYAYYCQLFKYNSETGVKTNIKDSVASYNRYAFIFGKDTDLYFFSNNPNGDTPRIFRRLNKITNKGTGAYTQLSTDSSMQFSRNGFFADNKFYSVNYDSPSKVWCYNLSNNTHSNLMDIPIDSEETTPNGDIVYYDTKCMYIDYVNQKIWKNSLDGDPWTYTTITGDIPSTLTEYSTTNIYNKCYVFGGKLNSGTDYTDTIYELDLLTGVSKLLDLKLTDKQKRPSLCIKDNSIYITGGLLNGYTEKFYCSSGSRWSTKINKFTVSFDIENNKSKLFLKTWNGISKSYLINDDNIKIEVDSCKYFYGDSNNKAASAPVYYHNGTDWVQFT